MTKAALHISRFKPSIFQGKLDFEAVSKRQSSLLAVEFPAERYAFMVLSFLLLLLIAGYFYFVIGSVFNVIAEREADARSNDLQGSIAALEQQYFSLSQALTP